VKQGTERLVLPRLLPNAASSTEGVLMRQGLAVLFVSIACFGCSSADTSTPSAACNSLTSAACNKESSCGSLGMETVAECTMAAEQLAGCSGYMCPNGTTYNSGNVNTCLDAVNSASCPFTTPSSCSLSLFCQ
jgi:hypothetical protein